VVIRRQCATCLRSTPVALFSGVLTDADHAQRLPFRQETGRYADVGGDEVQPIRAAWRLFGNAQ
jgi:hypothetical protein